VRDLKEFFLSIIQNRLLVLWSVWFWECLHNPHN
jgi:hypothetical protein